MRMVGQLNFHAISVATVVALFCYPALSFAQASGSLPNAGREVEAQVAPLETAINTTFEVYEDWRMSCADAAASSCRVWQRVQVALNGVAQDVMALSLAPAETETGFAFLIQLPLDVYLPDDIGLRVDGTAERVIRFRNCNAAGCWALLPADAALLRQLRRGLEGEVAFSLMEGERVQISFSLRGMTAALRAYEGAVRDRD